MNILAWLVPLLLAAPTPTPAPIEGVSLEVVDDSFSAPLLVTAPEGDDRLFVVERGGRVKVVLNDEVISTYFDVAHLLPSSPQNEQGLLGLAFHPDFASNGRLFFSYTNTAGHLVVARLIVNPSANTVSVANRVTVIQVNQFAANHNGGNITFGPDGMFYLGTGDGGGSGDPQNNGQNKNTLLGAILRLDVDVDGFPSDGLRTYSNPSDNPFVGTDGADEIWVYGLRNPWRFWFDDDTGRLYIADVGQNAREEVTVLEASAGGANLGWDRLEGSICYPPGASCSSAGTVLPQVEYTHAIGGSVTGGVVYRGTTIPSLRGTYFYADFVSGWVRSFRYDGTVTSHYDWDSRFNTNLVSSFGVDGHGEMYIVSLGGTVWRVTGPPLSDELFFYRDSGSFRYYDVTPQADLVPIRTGEGYSPNWDIVTSVDLDGDGDDEMLFYRNSQGTYKYYDVTPAANLIPILDGTGYSHKWDSISSVDMDGDGQDEMFFYDGDLGLYSYYEIRPNGTLGAKIRSGDDYSTGWDSVTAVDMDGDGQDEMFFYRESGSFRYYDVTNTGGLIPIKVGDGYSTGWDSITAVNIDGDGADEMFFYRESGSFRYYNVTPIGGLIPIKTGNGYSLGWDSITAVNLN
ncbi:MAG TPA: PQQ-dependent sugar dehydrogenase [Acidimicrobiia bacterium]|nr:PQQ-dependent sugar dehydrogenase [Acidimicrobiia bacterium]